MRSSVLLALLLACDVDPGPPPTAPTAAPSTAPTAAPSTAPTAAPSTAPTAAPSTAPTAGPLDLNLPTLDPDPPSPRPAPGEPRPPDSYRLPDGRRLIHDSHRDRIAVVDVDGRTIDLGEATLEAVPRLGWLIRPKAAPRLQYCDVDPTAARLRVLWEVPDHPAPAIAHAALAGLDRGAPLFLRRRHTFVAGSATAVPDPTAELIRVRGPGQVDITSVPLGAHSVPGADAVRDRRLLLLGPDRTDASAHDTAWPRPFTTPAILFDLETHTLRPLGDARGDHTRGTAVPHPYVALRWSDHDPHARDHGWSEDCVNIVDTASTTLTPCVTINPR